VLLLAGVAALLIAAVLLPAILRGRGHKPAPPTLPRVQPQGEAADAARAAVIAYMKHLQEGDYGAAHLLLTEESRKRHPLDEFARQARQGITLYDLSSARAKLTAPGQAEVTLHQEEDPASVTIVAVRQGGNWYVVYLRGRPGSPYP
jgi:hypothetical protein